MKNQFLLLVAALVLPFFSRANNAQCSITNFDTATNTLSVSFSWDNSWRITAGDNEFKDGLLLFIKYKDNLDPNWRRACIIQGIGGAFNGGGGLKYTYSQDYLPLTYAQAHYHVIVSRDTTNIGTGSVNGTANFTLYIPGAVNPSFKVFALEMVNVPEGAFYVGDGKAGSTTLHAAGSNDPYMVLSADSIPLGSSPGNLDDGLGNGVIPVRFPKAYNSFWMMKYELSQELYVAYLNCLTRTQQDAAIHPSVNLAVGTTVVPKTYVMNFGTVPAYNQGIRCAGTIPVSGEVTFYCDLNGDNVGSGVDDAQNNAVRVNTPGAVLQFLDWAGMRPMSGFEFEKACRGTATPVLNEYAWGSTEAFTPTTTTTGNAAENYTPVGNGPLVTTTAVRNGTFATATSTRRQSGGSYYGIMELSNSLPEMTVGYGTTVATSGYTSNLGDGNIANGLPATFPASVTVQTFTSPENRVSWYSPPTTPLTTLRPCAIRGVIQ